MKIGELLPLKVYPFSLILRLWSQLTLSQFVLVPLPLDVYYHHHYQLIHFPLAQNNYVTLKANKIQLLHPFMHNYYKEVK